MDSTEPGPYSSPSSLASSASANEEPAHVQRIELSELSAQPEDMDSRHGKLAPLVSTLHPLQQVKATLQVCVGSASLTVGELLGAQEQQVLQLDRDIHQPVDLLLEGHVIARGQLVAVGDHFAVRITELPLPMDLPGAAQP
ncbi:FliM/FliN family flagellar motor switch protein [Acidovorax sp. sic0104]|nr:FliM/FliN family flagellar motor switch protein [Acidovorax sp. sic0104]